MFALVTFLILGIQGQPLYGLQTPVGTETVGKLTDRVIHEAMEQSHLHEYVGEEGGVLSINGLGTKNEIVSPTEMKAYGWCYSVDGLEPDLATDQYVLTGQEQQILWWYAYAHYKDGHWIATCVPAEHAP